MRAPVGIRIRRQRLEMGISQAALARLVGISPSYLNLIESSKRDVGGALLMRIAGHLHLGLDELSGSREQKLIQIAQEALDDPILHGIDVADTDLRELVARFPEVAQALIRLHRAGSQTAAEVESFAIRFNSDPLLSQMLHEVLNRLTGLRSGVEIIGGVEDLTEADRRRFTGAVTHEARELSKVMRSLVGHFDQATVRRRGISALRQIEDAFITANNHFPALEDLADRLRAGIAGSFGEPALLAHLRDRHAIVCRQQPEDGTAPLRLARQARMDMAGRVLWLRASAPMASRIFGMCRQIAEIEGAEAIEAQMRQLDLDGDSVRAAALAALASYAAGAMMMPYADFRAAAEAHAYDVDRLSHLYLASFEQVAHRLTTLRRPGAEGVPFGFLRADPSGRLTKRFPLPGLGLPGGGHGCVLWPIYQTAGTSGVVRQVAEFPNGQRFLLIAKSVPKRVATWQEQPLAFSVMLACGIHHAERTVYAAGLNLDDTRIRVPVGPSCPLCIRDTCAYRQEEARSPV